MVEQSFVRDRMSPPTQTIESSHSVLAARQRMQSEMRVKSLIVVDGGRPVGMLRYNDINREGMLQATIAEMMVTEVPAAREDQTLDDLTGVMTEYDIDRLPVVDANGTLVGELPRAALTLAETTASAGATTGDTMAEAQSGVQTPNYDVRNDMTVHGADGSKIGSVKEVLADSLSGTLTHIVVHTGLIFGKDRSIPSDLIDNVSGDEVRLKVNKAEIDMLPDIRAES